MNAKKETESVAAVYDRRIYSASVKIKTILAIAGFVLCACLTISVAPRSYVQLNEDSLRFAEELIAQGHFVADKRNAWSDDQPSAEQENEFIREHGFVEYAKWYLGIDERHAVNSKARYKFPFGDFKNVRRSALLAIRSRARQYGYSEIESAAAELKQELELRAKSSKASRWLPNETKLSYGDRCRTRNATWRVQSSKRVYTTVAVSSSAWLDLISGEPAGDVRQSTDRKWIRVSD